MSSVLKRKKVLGRGIGALIGAPRGGDASAQAARPRGAAGEFLLSPVSEISANKAQPRKDFSAASLGELADSIRENGIIEPLVVRRGERGFEIIAGERRWRAAKLAGLAEVPVVVMEASDLKSLELAIVENIQREELNAIEEAEAYSGLLSFGLTQAEVAAKVGKDRATVANYLRLIKLPHEVKDEIIKGSISMGHARALLALEGRTACISACRTIVRKGLSVREAEALVAEKTPRARTGTAGRKQRVSSPLENELVEIFKTRVELREARGRGSVVVHYYSAEERERILDLLRSVAQE